MLEVRVGLANFTHSIQVHLYSAQVHIWALSRVLQEYGESCKLLSIMRVDQSLIIKLWLSQ